MKKLLFGLLATVLFSFNAKAQGKNNFNQKAELKSAVVTTKFNKEIVDYKFKSLDEFNEGFDNIIKGFEFDNTEYAKQIGKYEGTIEVTVSVTVGIATITMSGSVTANCADAVVTAKRLKSMLIIAALG